MTLATAMLITDCPPEAFIARPGRRQWPRNREHIAARQRVYMAMRCLWRQGMVNALGPMSLPDIAWAVYGGRRTHSTVAEAIRRCVGNTDPSRCERWLDRWAAERQEMAA